MLSKITKLIKPGYSRALLYICVGAVIVSFSSVFVKTANVAPTISAFYRMFFGAVMLLAVVWSRGETIWPGYRKLKLPLICAFFFALDLFFWHRSVLYVGPGLATLLGNCQVFFVALIAIVVLKERLHWQRALSIPVAMLGLFLILGIGWGGETELFKLGVLFGLLTAVAYALYIMIIRHSQAVEGKLSVFLNMTWISLFGAVMLGTAALFEGDVSFAIPDLQTWASLIGLGLLGQVLGWVLISKGLPDVDASVGGLALLLQPALAYAWDVLFFDRMVGGLEFIGVGITLAAIYLGTMGRKEKDLEEKKERVAVE